MFKFWRRKEDTSPEVASLASKGLRRGKDALTDAEFKSVCASALTQVHSKTAPMFQTGGGSGDRTTIYRSDDGGKTWAVENNA